MSTYRLQLRDSFGFGQAAEQAGYLAALGVTHVYLSPILQANPGSPHGYDVVDHSRVSADLGGEPAFREMVAEFHRHGLGVIVDVVPNHMARPVPETLNQQLWSVLYQGRQSEFAHWFDIDWDAQEGKLLLPILAGPLEECLGDLIIDTRPADPGERRAPRAGAALLRPRAPAPGRRGRPAPRRAAGPAALPAHRLARRGHPAQLPAVLRHRLAHGDQGRGSRTCSPPPTGCCCACCARG